MSGLSSRAAAWSQDDFIRIIDAKGPGSLTQVMNQIRGNLKRSQFKRIAAAALRPAAAYMSEQLVRALPRRQKPYPASHHRFGNFRYPGALRDSIKFQFIPAPKFRPWWSPIARVQALAPFGYVIHFLQGTGARKVKTYKQKPVAQGKGNRGSMPKRFDKKAFARRHSGQAIAMIVAETRRLINAGNMTRPARRIPWTPMRKHLDR